MGSNAQQVSELVANQEAFSSVVQEYVFYTNGVNSATGKIVNFLLSKNFYMEDDMIVLFVRNTFIECESKCEPTMSNHALIKVELKNITREVAANRRRLMRNIKKFENLVREEYVEAVRRDPVMLAQHPNIDSVLPAVKSCPADVTSDADAGKTSDAGPSDDTTLNQIGGKRKRSGSDGSLPDRSATEASGFIPTGASGAGPGDDTTNQIGGTEASNLNKLDNAVDGVNKVGGVNKLDNEVDGVIPTVIPATALNQIVLIGYNCNDKVVITALLNDLQNVVVIGKHDIDKESWKFAYDIVTGGRGSFNYCQFKLSPTIRNTTKNQLLAAITNAQYIIIDYHNMPGGAYATDLNTSVAILTELLIANKHVADSWDLYLLVDNDKTISLGGAELTKSYFHEIISVRECYLSKYEAVVTNESNRYYLHITQQLIAELSTKVVIDSTFTIKQGTETTVGENMPIRKKPRKKYNNVNTAVAVMQPHDYAADNEQIKAFKAKMTTKANKYISIKNGVLCCLKIKDLRNIHIMPLFREKVLKWNDNEHITFITCIIGMPEVERELFECLSYLSHVRIVFLLGHHSEVMEDDFKVQMNHSLKLLNSLLAPDQIPFTLPEKNYVAILYPGEQDENVNPRYIYYFIRKTAYCTGTASSSNTNKTFNYSSSDGIRRVTNPTSRGSCHTTPKEGTEFIRPLVESTDRFLDVGYGTGELISSVANDIMELNAVCKARKKKSDDHVYGFGTEIKSVFECSQQVDDDCSDDDDDDDCDTSSDDDTDSCKYDGSSSDSDANRSKSYKVNPAIPRDERMKKREVNIIQNKYNNLKSQVEIQNSLVSELKSVWDVKIAPKALKAKVMKNTITKEAKLEALVSKLTIVDLTDA